MRTASGCVFRFGLYGKVRLGGMCPDFGAGSLSRGGSGIERGRDVVAVVDELEAEAGLSSILRIGPAEARASSTKRKCIEDVPGRWIGGC